MIRPATIYDVPRFGKIINDCAEYGLMLHRSMAFLYEHVREFHVAEERGKVIGVCGLSVIWANLGEVYALAVTQDHRGKGIGRQLVEASVKEARDLGVRKLMTLTYETEFFSHLGFGVIDRQELPLKVWSQCIHCSKNQACDEIAMIRVLEDVPEPSATPPEPPAPDDSAFEVPVILEHSAPRRTDTDKQP